MKQSRSILRDVAITVGILSFCFCISVLMQDIFNIPEQVTTAFAFAVFLISLLTDGYGYGLVAAAVSVLLVLRLYIPLFCFELHYPIQLHFRTGHGCHFPPH